MANQALGHLVRTVGVVLLAVGFSTSCLDSSHPGTIPRGSAAYLSLRNADLVAVECGNGGPITPIWRQLYGLVEEHRLGELEALASSGTTPEARSLGIIGLHRIGHYSRATAEARLIAMSEPIATCSGCIIHPDGTGRDLLEFLDAPSPAEIERNGNNWRTPTEAIDLPGVPRVVPQSASDNTGIN